MVRPLVVEEESLLSVGSKVGNSVCVVEPQSRQREEVYFGNGDF